MFKDTNVFIIDHAISFRYPDLARTLKENPKIVTRLLEMLKYQDGEREFPHQEDLKIQTEETSLTSSQQIEPCEVEFDDLGLTELSSLEFPQNTITLSLCTNKLEYSPELIKKLEYLNLKVLWMNENPIESSEEFQQYIDQKTQIQLYNSKFTKHTTEWGLKYVQNRNIKEAILGINEKVFSLNLDSREVYNMDA